MEKLSRELIGVDGLNSGLVFPFGVSKNFIVAHYSPLPNDEMTLEEDDIFSYGFIRAFIKSYRIYSLQEITYRLCTYRLCTYRLYVI